MRNIAVRILVAAAVLAPSARVFAADELFVANTAANSILVYSRVAAGDSAPIRTISGPATGLNGPSTLVVDQVHGELLVTNQGNNSITVYSLTAGGNAAPIRTISGAATGLSNPQFLALTTTLPTDKFVSKVGFYRPSNSTFFLYGQDHFTLVSGAAIPYGGFNIDLPVVGDWVADGDTTLGVYRPADNAFYLRNANSVGPGDIAFTMGAPGDLPVVGDWDGNGTVTAGVYRPSNNTFYLSNDNVSVAFVIPFGAPGDLPVVGDWDGNGTTTVGVYRPSTNTFYLRNANSVGPVDITVTKGAPGDLPVVGDWDGNGTTTVGVYRPSNNTFYLTNDNSSVFARIVLPAMTSTDLPLVGHWF